MARAQNINPAILTWARETAGLSPREAARKLGLTNSARLSDIEKLDALENGVTAPTRTQLLKIANTYRRPLATFYLDHPPTLGERGEDFRTIAAYAPAQESAALDALLRDVRARQEMVRSLLEDDEDTLPLSFVGSSSIADGASVVALRIAKALGYAGLGKAELRRHAKPDDYFRDLRTRAENAKIFVLLIGDLGSHHSAISEAVFRGFAIADPIAPFVVLNDQDAKIARPFTLIHELAHIWLGKTGVSGKPEDGEPLTLAARTERFCNNVAAEFLLPSSEFQEKPAGLDPTSAASARSFIERLAQSWSVSEPMVAFKLHRLGWIAHGVYHDLSAEYAARWAALRRREREENRAAESGPSYYVVKRAKLGDALIDVVRRTVRENSLSHTKAAKVLGVKPSSVEPLIRAVERSRGAFNFDAKG